MNPYEIMKQSQRMPESLVQELAEQNNSLAKGVKTPVNEAYLDNRLRSDKSITFLSFVDDLRRLWEAAGRRGKFIRHTPIIEQIETFPVITFRIIRRQINDQFKDIKPRYRDTILHPYRPNQYVDLYGQIFDLWVEFCIFSKDAEEADELVMELEEFLQTYAGYFKLNGVQEILFHAQGEDEVLESNRIPVAKRKLLYTMRFEKIIVRFQNEIQQIAVQAKILHDQENE